VARFIAFSLLAALLILGCGGSSAGACGSGTPQAVVGTGPEDGMGFVSITNGQPATLTFGSQQGFHVWINVRAHNFCSDNPLTIKRSARIMTTGQVLSASSDQLPTRPATDPTLAAAHWVELPTSRPQFMCPNPLGLSVPGKSVELDVEVSDMSGHKASAQAVVVPTCPNNIFLMTCMSQCMPSASALDGGTQ
jgi:hypothetical protein